MRHFLVNSSCGSGDGGSLTRTLARVWHELTLIARQETCRRGLAGQETRKGWLLVLFLSLFISASAQYSAVDSIQAWHAATAENSGKIPQEMIYLHLDNTSYYRGDRIYFACYLVTSGKLAPSNLSQTVYVELLNPSGKVIDKCVLKAVDGRCHGSLLANETPFYSGYYEIRAYTRYMLNFGEEAIFSRVIPIYNEPKVEGDWADRTMLKYGSGNLAFNRPKPIKPLVIFYPEGGHLVAGLPAVVAFELTDKEGEGKVIDTKTDSVVATFKATHLGRGTFELTPQKGHTYKAMGVELPKVEDEGITLSVKDNMVTVSRTEGFPTTMVGVSLMCRGELYSRAILDFSEETTASFGIPRKKLPTGVIQVTLFDAGGNVLADRLFFNNKHDYVTASYEFADAAEAGRLRPMEAIELTVKCPTPFSISVTDADNQVAYGSNLLADLLLASEIKGYVHNPAWYFEAEGRDAELDNLLMLQGWRRYPWRHLAGLEATANDYLPEQGIEVSGTVLNSSRNKPMANAPMSLFLQKIHRSLADTVTENVNFDTFRTDSLGRFSFRTDVNDEWLMLLSVQYKGKVKPSRILLDAIKAPEPRRYLAAEMTDNLMERRLPASEQSQTQEDSIVISKGIKLKEVTVTAKGPENDIDMYRNTSSACYDIEEIHGDLLNQGKKYMRTLSDLLPVLDRNFSNGARMLYRDKIPIFVIDYEFVANIDVDEVNDWHASNFVRETGSSPIETQAVGTDISDFHTMLDYPLEAIKSVYINTENRVKLDWAAQCENRASLELKERMNIDNKYGCVVFVELYEHKRVKPVKGVRRIPLQGYTTPEEFYSPDYSDQVPDDADYRRTLYWDPLVAPDPEGNTRIRFYNNSTARRLNVTTATLPYH